MEPGLLRLLCINLIKDKVLSPFSQIRCKDFEISPHTGDQRGRDLEPSGSNSKS